MLPVLLRRPRALACVLTCLGAVVTALAADGASASTAAPGAKLTPYGDLRLRYERDWDSHTGAGVRRADRDRGRVRARLGANVELNSHWSVNVRVRTGDRRSQQSPHLTFQASDGVTDDAAIQADRYFAQYKDGALLAWGGRNGFPFWQQNELILDEDVTPTGGAGTYEMPQGREKLAATLGVFALPDGMNRLHGTMTGMQLKYMLPVNKDQFTTAIDFYAMHGEPGAKYLRNGNGARDYLIGALKAQWTTQVSGRPLSFGADLIRNFETYDAGELAPFPLRHRDERTGYDVSVQLGQLKKPHDWLIAYAFAHIETLAVNAAYAQDDWARFGANGQSDVTDIEGHELRAAYALTKSVNVMARAFFVEAITSAQDGKRFRIDLNWKF